jgi:hypothetical protein
LNKIPQAKLSNSSGLTATSSYPRGGVYINTDKRKQLSLLDKREYPNGGGSLNEYTRKSFKLLRPDGHLLLSKRRSFSTC